MRVAGEQAFIQLGHVEPCRQRAQGGRLGERGVGVARQQGIDEGGLLPVIGFHADQFVVERAALDLGTNRILLCRKATGVAHLGDLLQLAAQINVFAGQLQRPVGQPVLRVQRLDATSHLGPGIGGAPAGLLGLGSGNLALQIALAPERQRLRQQVFGIANPRRRQGRLLRAAARDVLQLDSQERIGQRAGRADALLGRFRLQPHHAHVRAAFAGDGKQRFDAGAGQRLGVGKRRQGDQQRAGQ